MQANDTNMRKEIAETGKGKNTINKSTLLYETPSAVLNSTIAIMGCSLRNQELHEGKLFENFAHQVKEQNYKQHYVLLGDIIQNLTEQIILTFQNKIPCRKEQNVAAEITENWRKRNGSTIKIFETTKIFSCTDVINQDQGFYNRIKQEIESNLKFDKNFNAAFEKDAETFIQRALQQIKKAQKVNKDFNSYLDNPPDEVKNFTKQLAIQALVAEYAAVFALAIKIKIETGCDCDFIYAGKPLPSFSVCRNYFYAHSDKQFKVTVNWRGTKTVHSSPVKKQSRKPTKEEANSSNEEMTDQTSSSSSSDEENTSLPAVISTIAETVAYPVDTSPKSDENAQEDSSASLSTSLDPKVNQVKNEKPVLSPNSAYKKIAETSNSSDLKGVEADETVASSADTSPKFDESVQEDFSSPHASAAGYFTDPSSVTSSSKDPYFNMIVGFIAYGTPAQVKNAAIFLATREVMVEQLKLEFNTQAQEQNALAKTSQTMPLPDNKQTNIASPKFYSMIPPGSNNKVLQFHDPRGDATTQQAFPPFQNAPRAEATQQAFPPSSPTRLPAMGRGSGKG